MSADVKTIIVNDDIYKLVDETAREQLVAKCGEGDDSEVSAQCNKATGNYSHAEGRETTASGESAHAEGEHTLAQGKASHSEGGNCQALGDYSHAEGCNSGDTPTISNCTGSHAEGRGTLSSGSGSHSEGVLTQALREASHAEGRSTKVEGDCGHAEGEYSTVADGSLCGHAEGYACHANGKYTHAEGQETTANGNASHTEGYGNTTGNDAACAHAEGDENAANGYASHVEGKKNIANGEYQHVQGKYNVVDSSNKYAHIVGGGTSDNDRKNIHTIDWQGNAEYSGDIVAKGNSLADISRRVSNLEESKEGTTIYIVSDLEYENCIFSNQTLGDVVLPEDRLVDAEDNINYTYKVTFIDVSIGDILSYSMSNISVAHPQTFVVYDANNIIVQQTYYQNLEYNEDFTEALLKIEYDGVLGVFVCLTNGEYTDSSTAFTLIKASSNERKVIEETVEFRVKDLIYEFKEGIHFEYSTVGTIYQKDEMLVATDVGYILVAEVKKGDSLIAPYNQAFNDYCYPECYLFFDKEFKLLKYTQYYDFTYNESRDQSTTEVEQDSILVAIFSRNRGLAEYQDTLCFTIKTEITVGGDNPNVFLLNSEDLEKYIENTIYGDEALKAILGGKQLLVRVPNADGGSYTAIYSPIMMYQLPNYENNYLYLFFLRDEKQDFSAVLGLPEGTAVMPTYGQLKMKLSKTYNQTPLL